MTFGKYFVEKRKEKGLTKDDILKLTKVRKVYLEALEEDRFNALPPKAFVVGFLRSVAKILQTDENELVQKYLMELSEQEETIKENSLVYREYQVNVKKNLLLWAGLILVIVLIILSPLFFKA
ncbi:MAG TPA: helix-turn-helix domain-containing protein [Oligoflexia bacterium]|nr:helix-turn-helix domain-containing protein [Oligoflexia bacterium]HMR24133.1 helix-turn-helix domain-containing protein [Oligoflexia bacterium]